MDGEKVILTNAELSLAGLFTINAGTTLVLDENITVDGQHKYLYAAGGNGRYLFHVNGGTLEMKEGSKITRSVCYSYIEPSSVLMADGAFKMHGGSTIDQSWGRYHVVLVRGGSFEMWEGAKITNNTMFYEDQETGSSTIASNVMGGSGVVDIENTATFIMHGGEISHNDYRGVKVSGTSTFIMKGGRIINNGNSGYSFNGTYTYPRGGGVYGGSSAKFHMEGGEISGNGNTDTPGSGIWMSVKAATTDNFVLNGPVTIQNNTMLLSKTVDYGVKIGSQFSATSPIEVDLGSSKSSLAGSTINATGFITEWPANKVLFYALDEESPITINEAVTAQFNPAKCFFYSSSVTKSYVECPTLNVTIHPDSSVTIVENGNGS
jgi:hypothetical protein